MSKSKDRARGIIGTVIFHGALLFVLIFFALRTPLPLPGEEGVEVNLGNSDLGKGFEQQPVVEEPPPAPPPQPEPKEETIQEEEQIEEDIQEEEVLNEDAVEMPTIDSIYVSEMKFEAEEVDIEMDLDTIVEEAIPDPDPVPIVNRNALYKGKSKKTGRSSNEGITTYQGDQGRKEGSPESLSYDGLGGEGDGVSFSLGGRGAKTLPKPTYDSPEQGKIVVTIWVDKDGNVIRAVDGAKGTNISDLQLRRLAREAALRAKFTPDPNAPDVQKGTITYNFIRLN
ncbi:MAG: hypothetical protein CL663_06420 [Bacteroidetes bacterium]|nr:hypothetical protein [Bacteroidota bacterium]